MAEFKLVISMKDGKSYQREVKDDQAKPFLGQRIGNTVKGDKAGLAGYEFQITGGSDDSGFPMRKDVDGTGKKRILAVKGIGIRKKRPGQRQRKTVAGNTVHAGIAQINLKVTKAGKESLGGEEAPKEEKAKDDKPKDDKPKDDKPKEDKPKEDKPKEDKPKEDKPKEEKAKDSKPQDDKPKDDKPKDDKPK